MNIKNDLDEDKNNLEKNIYDVLKLKNQICFPLYACAKEVIKKYKEDLDKIDLTYTQYIAMIVLWEEDGINVKELGNYLFLDSGTLTSVLKKLEAKGLVTRRRSKIDERNLVVILTDKGIKLKDEAVSIPLKMAKKSNITPEEAATLYKILYKVLGKDIEL